MNNPLGALADKLADVFAHEGERTRAILSAGFAKTVDAARVDGALAVPIGSGGRLRTARGRLLGWSLRETAGNPATVTIYGGSDNTDPTKVLATIPLAANAGATLLPSTPGVFYGEGITVTVTGAVTGALYVTA